MVRIPTNARSPATVVIQNSEWKSACSATKPASGSPSEPPTPSIALIRAIEEPTRSRGISAASRLIPSGIAAAEMPWIPRPTISQATLLVRAVMSEPIVSAAIATSSISRLPNMSPSRPMIGTDTAATRRVEVSSQLTLPAEVFSLAGRIESTGISTDWASETTRAPRPTTSSSSVARRGEVWAAISASWSARGRSGSDRSGMGVLGGREAGRTAS